MSAEDDAKTGEQLAADLEAKHRSEVVTLSMGQLLDLLTAEYRMGRAQTLDLVRAVDVARAAAPPFASRLSPSEGSALAALINYAEAEASLVPSANLEERNRLGDARQRLRAAARQFARSRGVSVAGAEAERTDVYPPQEWDALLAVVRAALAWYDEERERWRSAHPARDGAPAHPQFALPSEQALYDAARRVRLAGLEP